MTSYELREMIDALLIGANKNLTTEERRKRTREIIGVYLLGGKPNGLSQGYADTVIAVALQLLQAPPAVVANGNCSGPQRGAAPRVDRAG
jgi:hypothetical protein